jgi:hypothetical protein
MFSGTFIDMIDGYMKIHASSAYDCWADCLVSTPLYVSDHTIDAKRRRSPQTYLASGNRRGHVQDDRSIIGRPFTLEKTMHEYVLIV